LVEIFYTLNLLAQLTFNEDIKLNMNSSKEFEKIFANLNKKELKKQENETDKLVYSSIRQVLDQIQWNLNSENRRSNVANSLQTLSLSQSSYNDQQHIMISYYSASRELCLKIKKELESMGHKVWIDVNTISGSTLESMANAVENSFCILMCVTEKYRQSINCQLEAKYALKRNKPIIPLIMQQGFEDPNGWLGFIMSDKIFVNFMKYDFEECIKRLKLEINSIKDGTKIKASNSSKGLSDSAKNWTEARAKEWFIQNGLSLLILEHFKPCDGKILKQMYDTKSKAYEFYFKSLSEIKKIEYKHIFAFSACLDELFN